MGAMTNHKPARGARAYRCFLIRCRQAEDVGEGEAPSWRFTVQEADRGALRRCFSSLPEVEAYLEAELGQPGGRVKHAEHLNSHP